ncbi:hypothetical protein THOG11_20016 [Vibrio harveyi]|nr:hypothetical protein TH15OA1_530379 [Vibrio harveyi]CAH1554308.1 hypothetical protein THOD03_20016 [Vibrio harveyi]CAH1561016.1 hypothetical protein THOG11_20016 [Vibrio harveyi]
MYFLSDQLFLVSTEIDALITPLFKQGGYRKWTPTIQKT